MDKATARIRFTAIFKGQDGSMGYRNGKTYVLYVSKDSPNTIIRDDGTGECRYADVWNFLANWRDINYTPA